MSKSVSVLLRVERDTKAQAEQILAAYDVTIGEAFELFLRQVIADRGLPFKPNPQYDIDVGTIADLIGGLDVPAEKPERSDQTSVRSEEIRRKWEELAERTAARRRAQMTGQQNVQTTACQLRPNAERAPRWWDD